jgi:hypothetical protein
MDANWKPTSQGHIILVQPPVMDANWKPTNREQIIVVHDAMLAGDSVSLGRRFWDRIGSGIRCLGRGHRGHLKLILWASEKTPSPVNRAV